MAMILRLIEAPTDPELFAWSRRNEGYEFERDVHGRLIVTPMGGTASLQKSSLLAQIGAWAERHGGVAFSPTVGYHLPDGALFVPAASWVSSNRWNALTEAEKEGFPPLSPDAAFELVSWGTQVWEPVDLRAKTRMYLANGSRLSVLIDPEGGTVEVYRPGRQPEIHRGPTTVALGPELPGFVLDLSVIFEA
jgi:Uma2 family endonuclease